MSPCIDIVIVNWNAGNQLAVLLQSIAQFHAGLVNSVVIVDNHSSDDSIARVKALDLSDSFELRIICNLENRGFGVACNQGAASCSSPFILFLNPDTRLFAESLAISVRYLEAHEHADVGVVGIQLVDESGQVSRSCARFPTAGIWVAQAVGLSKLPPFRRWSMHMADWSHEQTCEVDHVIGAYYLVRRSIFDCIRGFDPRFFVYLEDLDLSLRIRSLGYRVVYLTGVQAFHAGGGTSRQIKATRLYYSLRSRLAYAFKHFSRPQAWLVTVVTLTLEPLSRSLLALATGGEGLLNTWVAYQRLYRSLPAILSQAHRQ